MAAMIYGTGAVVTGGGALVASCLGGSMVASIPLSEVTSRAYRLGIAIICAAAAVTLTKAAITCYAEVRCIKPSDPQVLNNATRELFLDFAFEHGIKLNLEGVSYPRHFARALVLTECVAAALSGGSLYCFTLLSSDNH